VERSWVASPGSAAVRPTEIAVVGMSVSQTCGVRDHAGLLADALSHNGASFSFHWLLRSETSLAGARAQIHSWTRRLATELEQRRPDAVLLHYSVFSYSYRGLPLFVRPTLSALRASKAPAVIIAHEFAYPWRHGGLRGDVWALAQRIALRPVVQAAAAVIATADFRVTWLQSRRWLPRRPTLLAPVFSNLPSPLVGPPRHAEPIVGLFGYSYMRAAGAEMILDALGELRRGGRRLHLRLLGAPGRSSPVGAAWLSAARHRGLEDVLSFSGVLPGQELADMMASCDVLLFADTPGPTSRKGSLAASLASGRPVVAIDGPDSWSELIDARALQIVQPTPARLAEAVGALLDDEDARESLGARGRSFAENEMGVGRTVEAVTSLLDDVLSAPGS
jgi:glycosyltransferase involved in cell wall biosynthesis